MSDQKRPDLFVPDPKIVSLDEAREQEGQPKRRPLGRDGDMVTVRQFRDAVDDLNRQIRASVVEGVSAIGEAVHENITLQTQQYLQDMERDLLHAVYARLENERRARTWYGRWRRLLMRLGAQEKPLAMIDGGQMTGFTNEEKDDGEMVCPRCGKSPSGWKLSAPPICVDCGYRMTEEEFTSQGGREQWTKEGGNGQ